MSLRTIEKRVMRALGLSPMRRVLRGLRSRGIDIAQMRALDVFAADGTGQVLCYCRAVRELEAWELNPRMVARLRVNVPNAIIRHVDSYKQIALCGSRFDLIVIDNAACIYGAANEHCEHFGLFPAVFRVCNDDAVLVLTVATDTRPVRRNVKYTSDVGTPEHLQRRAQFYRTMTPETISLEQMAAAYADHCAAYGFELEWWFAYRRRFTHTQVLKIHKRADLAVAGYGAFAGEASREDRIALHAGRSTLEPAAAVHFALMPVGPR